MFPQRKSVLSQTQTLSLYCFYSPFYLDLVLRELLHTNPRNCPLWLLPKASLIEETGASLTIKGYILLPFNKVKVLVNTRPYVHTFRQSAAIQGMEEWMVKRNHHPLVQNRRKCQFRSFQLREKKPTRKCSITQNARRTCSSCVVLYTFLYNVCVLATFREFKKVYH